MVALGRLEAKDPRDEQYLMRALLLVRARPIHYRYHAPGKVLDQGTMPACVGYAWQGLHIGSPERHPLHDPLSIYREAQQIDEWPGENYDGTSIRAGAKVMQSYNHIVEYYWAFDLKTVVEWVLLKGPVVLGTMWYEDMFYPNVEGFIHLSGRFVGGHAYVINGANSERGIVRCMNSWGREWGRNGHFYMDYETLERLLNENGEACTATETRAVKKKPNV